MALNWAAVLFLLESFFHGSEAVGDESCRDHDFS